MQDRADIMVYSSFLAREGIELMYNVRDANYAKKLDRNCIFKDATVSETQFFSEKDNPFCQGYFTGGDILMLSIGSE